MKTRSGISLLRALALLLGALGLFVPAPAAVLVSNVGQMEDSTGTLGATHAQGFTTGSNANGYDLTSIDFNIKTTSAAHWQYIRAELWSDDNGEPDARITRLTAPATPATGDIAFSAPQGTTLKANTAYHFVIYSASALATTVIITNTESDSEDTGAAAGWSIANGSHWTTGSNPTSSTSWTDFDEARRLRVNGSNASSNADLGGLTASGAANASGPFSAFTLTPAFSASTTSYTATVVNTVTHAKLTPTVADTGRATVTVGGTDVPSGSASEAISLSVGSNSITVQVTAQDSTTKDYTVTVTRQPALSSNANLGGLTASEAASVSGPFSALDLTPAFSASTISYTATVANTITHAKLTPTVADTGRATVTVDGTSVNSGSASAAIPLNEGSNSITVRVTAQDSTTKDYTVTVTRQGTTPAVTLTVSPNPVTEGQSAELSVRLAWTLANDVDIPLVWTDDTAESGDYTRYPQAAITIPSGSQSASYAIQTHQDADTADETFTVALGNLPSEVTAGNPASVRVRITDDGAGSEDAEDADQDELTQGPLKLALWTDRIGYSPGQPLRLYRTIDPRRSLDEYAVLLYLERVGPQPGQRRVPSAPRSSAGRDLEQVGPHLGRRRYLAPRSGSDALRAERVDQHGRPPGSFRVIPLAELERELTWQGTAPAEPGLWQFVLELQVGREGGEPLRMWAKFAVGPSRLLNRRGFQREVTDELTLPAGRVHYLLDRLTVRPGATLRLEPGALLMAFGPQAEIVVEPGGRIEASGTRQAPVVLTCSLPPGQRAPGCWAGLRIYGRAPVTGYGGDQPADSSGWLRHVRVEFAGAGPEPGSPTPALALHGVGSGTALEHLQARSSAGDGIAFSGGTASCDHCVASASGGTGVSWQRGFCGRLSRLYVWQGAGSSDAIDGGHLASGPDRQPRAHPALSNVTVTTGGTGGRWSKGAGLRLRHGSALLARQLLVYGFAGGALAVGPRSWQLLADRVSSVSDSAQWNNRRALRGWNGAGAEFRIWPPRLRNAGTDPNHDPCPESVLPARGDPPGEADYVGAFEQNWLEQWTVFGAESDYDTRNMEDSP